MKTENKITLYTKEDCKYCDLSKKWLRKANLDFQEVKIGTDIERDVVREMFPDSRTAPIVVWTQVKTGGSEIAWDAAKEEIENKKERDRIHAKAPN